MTAKYAEIAKLDEKELTQKALELKQELAKERAAIASGTRAEKPAKIKNIKKEIARTLTAMSAKKNSANAKKNNTKAKEARK